MLAAVDVGTEGHALFRDPAQMTQAEGLETAAIREDGTGPAHKGLEAAQIADNLYTWPEHEVVCIGEQDGGLQCPEVIGGNGFDRPLGGHRHERGRLYLPVGSVQQTGSCRAIGGVDLELECHEGYHLRLNIGAVSDRRSNVR